MYILCVVIFSLDEPNLTRILIVFKENLVKYKGKRTSREYTFILFLILTSFTHSNSKPNQMNTQGNTKHQAPTQYKKGDKYIVPPEGSLGLLALGYQGLVAWRKAQEEAKASAKQQAGDIKVEAEIIELPVTTDE